MTQTQLKTDRWRVDSLDLDQAIKVSVSPLDPYAVGGELELLRWQVDRLTGIVGVLVRVLDGKHLLTKDDIHELVDYNFEIAE